MDSRQMEVAHVARTANIRYAQARVFVSVLHDGVYSADALPVECCRLVELDEIALRSWPVGSRGPLRSHSSSCLRNSTLTGVDVKRMVHCNAFA
eukprot:5871919-Pleurochrysis_carterae.AAC.3